MHHRVKRVLVCLGPNEDENREVVVSLERLGDVEVRLTKDMVRLNDRVLLPFIVLDDLLDEDGRNYGSRFYGLSSILRFVRELIADVVEE